MMNRLNWFMTLVQACWTVARSGKLDGKAFASAGKLVNEWLEKALQAQVRAEPQEQVEQHRRQDDQDMVGNRIEAPHQGGDQSGRWREFNLFSFHRD